MIINPDNAEQIINHIGEKPLVIYGMGVVGKMIADWCDENGIEYVYVDRDAKGKQGKTDKRVLYPSELKNECIDSMVVIASINYYDEIKINLKKIGISEERIMSWTQFWPESVAWEEIEGSVDWENVRRRAGVYAQWVNPKAKSIANFGYKEDVLREFLPPDMIYYAPSFIRADGDGLLADFNSVKEILHTEVAFCMASLVFFKNPEEVIRHIIEYTEKTVIISYVPVDRLANSEFRRRRNIHNDYTEKQFENFFLEQGFHLIKKEKELSDSVNIVYMFEKD